MKKKIKLLAGVMCLCMIFPAVAQDDDDKIVVEITKEIDGEKQTFKGEYNSTEEMYADPNYQEFAGDDNPFHFWSGDDHANPFFHLDGMKDMQSHIFKFLDDEEGANSFFYRDFDDDSSLSAFNFNLKTRQYKSVLSAAV